MCDGHGHHHEWESGGWFAQGRPVAPHAGPSRRDVLRAGAWGAGAIALSGLMPGLGRAAWGGPAAAASPGLDGATPFRTAQHIHARGSEGPGSMTAQASEAAQWVDAMWFTDHDWREAGIGAPTVVHFNSLTGEQLGANPSWKWTRQNSGAVATGSGGGIDTTHVSTRDPDPTGCLYARAVSDGSGRASVVWYADDDSLRNSMRTPAHGQTWSLDVLLRQAAAGGWAFLRVALSYHPATSGRADAYYFLEYRFGPFARKTYAVEQLTAADLGSGGDDGDGAGSITLQPGEQVLLGVVNLPQTAGSYRTRTLTFTDDIAALFPGMVARDNSIRGLWLGATSTNGSPTTACFDYLTMSRVRGQDQLEDRRAISQELASRFPSVRMYHGSEVSYDGQHRQWLGGDVTLSTYGGTTKAKGAPTPTPEQEVQTILAGGGFPIANHPFGTNGPKLSDDQAAARAASVVAGLLGTGGGGGLKGIEVFYRMRAGASLEQHWRLYRLALRNGLVLTASGSSDNHWGRVGSWQDETNHFITSLYADEVSETSLLDAQDRGRAFCSELNSFDGALDLSLDDDVMGQIGVRPHAVTRTLTVQASQLPAGATVEVWQVPVDLGGVTDEPGGVVARIPASSFRGTTASMRLDTRTDSAFAVMVADGQGRHVAGTNPIWHLRSEPTQWSIPENRRAS